MKRTLPGLACLIFVLALLSACSANTPRPAPAPIGTPTAITVPSTIPSQTPSPFQTPVSTNTPLLPTVTPSIVPSLTEFPTPSGKGPYLITSISSDQESQLAILDADGRGQQIIDLPKDIHIWSVTDIASPDGKWLAYHTGDMVDGSLTLNIFSLNNQTTRTVAKIVGPDLTNRLYEIAKKIAKENQATSPLTAEDWLQEVQNTFLPGLQALAWSPDSQTLAFTAQIDGPSTDLYLYDLKTSTVRRLIDDLENVYQIHWALDGKHILLENAIPRERGYMGLALYILDAKTPLLTNPRPALEGLWFGTEGWLSPKLAAIVGHGDGGPFFDLRTLSMDTGKVAYQWSGGYASYAFDPENRLLAISGIPSDLETADPEYQLFLVYPNGSRKALLNGEIRDLKFRGGVRSRFVASNTGGIIAIAKDGTTTQLTTQGADQLIVSPDHRWLIVANSTAFEIFSETDELVKTIEKPELSEVLWRPDSAGFFFYSGSTLYYESMPDGEPVVVPSIIPNGSIDISRAVWVP